MAGHAQNPYKKVALQTASPRQLMAMAHERALGFLRKSIEQLELGSMRHHKALLRNGQALVLQMPQLLDLESGEELTLEICRLYAYVNRRLLLADLYRDAEPIREVVLLLNNMLSVWRGPSATDASAHEGALPRVSAVRYA